MLFDELADRLGIDPLEFRLLNALGDGVPTVCGQVFAQGVGIGARLAALKTAWDRERADAKAINGVGAVLRRGVGIAAGWHGCGNTSLPPNPSTIKAGIRADGRLFLQTRAQWTSVRREHRHCPDLRRGAGVPLAQLALVGPDTDVTPDAGKTSASRQTFVSGNAARLSGLALRAEILRHANAGEGAKLTLGDGFIEVADGAGTRRIDLSALPPDGDGYVLRSKETYDPPTRPLDGNGQGEPYAQFGYAAHSFVVVEVDTALGLVRPLRPRGGPRCRPRDQSADE